MTTPDKIHFIRRRVWMDQFELIPRRRDDKRLFDRLTQRQEDAYNRIEEAHGYEMAGLPQARMRYEERTDRGHGWELTPSQMQIVLDYRDWQQRQKIETFTGKGFSAAYYAVIAYMTGATLRQIDAQQKRRKGTAIGLISAGLADYCAMKNWHDTEATPHKKIKPAGFSAEIKKFMATGMGKTGLPEWVRAEKAQESTDFVG